MSNTINTYDIGSNKYTTELVVTPVLGRESNRTNYKNDDQGLRELRRRVSRLRELGYTRGKIRGGLDRAFRVLGGKD